MRPNTGSSPRYGAHIRSISAASLYACRASTTSAGRRPSRERPPHLVHLDAGVALDGEHAAAARAQALRGAP